MALAGSDPNEPRRKTMDWQPIKDRLIVRPQSAEEVSAGGVIIPAHAQEKPNVGEVIMAGQGGFDGGEWVPMTVVAGDTVLYSKYGGTELELDGEKVVVLRESDVLARKPKEA
jgi:chaperonin GroES